MVRFVVPVKSKKVCDNWLDFCGMVERTLKSICSQINKDFEVVVVCHELPDINYINEKITYIQVDFEPPITKGIPSYDTAIKEQDKARKIRLGCKMPKNSKVTYVMIVDSDDLISNKITQFVLNTKIKSPGWYLDSGYFYQEGKKFAFLKKPGYNLLCGSCIIIKPELIEQFIIPNPRWSEDLYDYFNHQTIQIDSGILLPLPFPGGIYSMANGENIVQSSKNVKSIASKLFTKEKIMKMGDLIRKYSFRYMDTKKKLEFGLYKLN